MEGRHGRLERQTGQDQRQPDHEQRVVRLAGRGDLVEAEPAGRAVHERRPEEQDRRAEAADDQVLQARLERFRAVRVEGAEDVQRDREPLQPEEQRHQVGRLDEKGHAAAGSCEEREVLADVVAALCAPRDQHGDCA